MRKQEMTKEEYESIPVYMKNRIEPVFICSKNTKETLEAPIEVVDSDDNKVDEGKHSYTDIKDMNKKEQIKILKAFGLTNKDIKKLIIEEDRIQKILQLENSNE